MTATEPTFTLLLDWLEGRLDEQRAAEVAAQVAIGDAETQERVAWIREFLDAAKIMPLQTPPPELSTRLRDVFSGFHGPRQTPGWTEASLLYDTRDQVAAAGVRSVHDGVSLAFDSEVGRFVLEVSPAAPGVVDLQGLIMMNPGAEGVDLAFMEAGSLCRAARAERDGRFDVPSVPSTADELWMSSGDTRVRVPLDLSRA